MCSAGECGNIALFHMSAHSKRKAKWRGMMAPFPQRDPTGAFSVSVWLSMYENLIPNLTMHMHDYIPPQASKESSFPAACPMDHGVGL